MLFVLAALGALLNPTDDDVSVIYRAAIDSESTFRLRDVGRLRNDYLAISRRNQGGCYSGLAQNGLKQRNELDCSYLAGGGQGPGLCNQECQQARIGGGSSIEPETEININDYLRAAGANERVRTVDLSDLGLMHYNVFILSMCNLVNINSLIV